MLYRVCLHEENICFMFNLSSLTHVFVFTSFEFLILNTWFLTSLSKSLNHFSQYLNKVDEFEIFFN